jgi:CheY-like chemotaxis protein
VADGRILVVEDEPDLRGVMAETLEACGYEVLQAENGKVALDVLHASPRPRIILILLDLLMPTMNGWDMLAALDAEPALAAIPVVAVTARASQAPESVWRVLRKPFTLDALLACVRELMSRAPPRRD